MAVTDPGDRRRTAGSAITPVQVQGAGSSGAGLTYKAAGLPAGLSLDSSTGRVSLEIYDFWPSPSPRRPRCPIAPGPPAAARRTNAGGSTRAPPQVPPKAQRPIAWMQTQTH
ncbi:Ig domain-containing protein [Streptomyces sp. NPDC050422]|uniref:Ig domain-containing protein n=1 Tax=Streptomyces sp. NPDC050422 TaxID=3365614 RepID=UPI0037BAF3D0